MTATPADSLAIAQLAGAMVDGFFNGMDPAMRSVLIGVIVSVVYQFTWKKLVSPATDSFPQLTLLWEQNRARLNAVAPALAALILSLLQGRGLDWNSLIAVLGAWGGYGILKGLGSVWTAKPTVAGQRGVSAAAGLLVAGLLLSSPASAEPLSTAFKARFNPTIAFGLVERWEGFVRFGGPAPTPRLAVQPGLNWNDSIALRGRIEWGMQQAGRPMRHQWSGEVGIWYVPQPKR